MTENKNEPISSNNPGGDSHQKSDATSSSSDIFSLDSIDDSWMDDKEDFSSPPPPPPPSKAKTNPPSQQPPQVPAQKLEAPKVNAVPTSQPGVPKQGVVPASTGGQNSEPAKIAKQASLQGQPSQDKVSSSFHGWVENAGEKRTHGNYRNLGGYSSSPSPSVSNLQSSQSSVSTSNAVLNAVPGKTEQAQSEMVDNQAQLSENLLSGNYQSPQSVKAQQPIYHEVSQKPKPADQGLSISQMLQRDFENDPLIDGNLEGEFSSSQNQIPVSQPPQEAIPTPKPVEMQANEPIAPKEPPAVAKTPDLPVQSKPSKKEQIETPSPEPTKFTKPTASEERVLVPPPSAADSASKPSHLSRKDFSKSGASRRLPFRIVVVGVILIGIVIGVGLYQLKGTDGGKESTPVDKIAKEPSSVKVGESPSSDLPLANSGDRIKNWQRDFDKGLRFLGQKNYEKAIVYLSTSIAEEDDHPEVYHSRGRAYSKSKNYELAIKDFSHALKLKGKDENILLDRAAAYVYSDESKKALRDYSKILRINPANAKASYGRGLVYVKQHKYKKALSDFEKTIEADPYYVNSYLRMGLIYSGQDQNKKAIEVFNKAIKYEPRADLYYERALANYAENNLDSAISDLTEAIALKSDKKEYFNDRGYVYLKMGKPKNAKKDFEKALSIDPQYKLAKENLDKVKDQ